MVAMVNLQVQNQVHEHPINVGLLTDIISPGPNIKPS